MKLIFCPACQDIVKLTSSLRYCLCGESHGYYLDGTVAQIGGRAIPLGIANSSFTLAIESRPDYGQGKEFTAFVIPRASPHIINGGESYDGLDR